MMTYIVLLVIILNSSIIFKKAASTGKVKDLISAIASGGDVNYLELTQGGRSPLHAAIFGVIIE